MPRPRIGLLTPLDGEIWALRLAVSELATLEADWATVAGPAPGHDFRRAVVRMRDVVERARRDVAAGRAPPEDWVDRARAHARAARRVLVRRQLEHFVHLVDSQRRYFA
jgi:hypothetical protein